MPTADLTTSASDAADSGWRAQYSIAARSAPATTPASTCGSSCPAGTPRRRATASARSVWTEVVAFRYSPCRAGSAATSARKSFSQPGGSPLISSSSYCWPTASTSASASGSAAGRASRAAASRAPRSVAGHAIAASLLAK